MRLAPQLLIVMSTASTLTVLNAAMVGEAPTTTLSAPSESPESPFDLTLPDLNGAPHKLAELAGANATVIAFTSGSCPLSRKLAPELDRIDTDFESRGVAVIRVATRDEDKDALRAALKGRRCLIDDADALARIIRPASTTEVFVFGADRQLQYRGAINDQYGLSYARPYPRSNYLRSVLDAVLRGDTPLVRSTVAPGCAIAIRRQSIESPTATYYAHIAPLVAQHCLECHRSGGPAPFQLETYDQVLRGPP